MLFFSGRNGICPGISFAPTIHTSSLSGVSLERLAYSAILRIVIRDVEARSIIFCYIVSSVTVVVNSSV